MKVVLPKLGLTITEAEIGTWHVQVGSIVAKGDLLVEIAMDKADVEVESPTDGVVASIHAEEGEIVEVGSTLAVIETEEHAQSQTAGTSDATSTATDPARSANATPLNSPSTHNEGDSAETGDATVAIAPEPIEGSAPIGGLNAAAAANTTPPADQAVARRTPSSPRARKLATNTGVDVNVLQGTGPGGRVVSRDVEAAAPMPDAQPSAAPIGTSAVPQSPAPPSPVGPSSGLLSAAKVIPLPHGAHSLTQEQWLALWTSTAASALRRTPLIPGPSKEFKATIQFGPRLESRLSVDELGDLSVVGVARRLSSAMASAEEAQEVVPADLHVIDLGQCGLDEVNIDGTTTAITVEIGRRTAGVSVAAGHSGSAILIEESVRVRITCDNGAGQEPALVLAFANLVESLSAAASQLVQMP